MSNQEKNPNGWKKEWHPSYPYIRPKEDIYYGDNVKLRERYELKYEFCFFAGLTIFLFALGVLTTLITFNTDMNFIEYKTIVILGVLTTLITLLITTPNFIEYKIVISAGAIVIWLIEEAIKVNYLILLCLISVGVAMAVYGLIVLFKSARMRYDYSRDTTKLIKKVFSWEDVPGKDNERLLKHLWDDLKIDLENVVIQKSEDKKTITLTKCKNSPRFELNGGDGKVILKINDVDYEYLFEEENTKENTKLNIYPLTK